MFYPYLALKSIHELDIVHQDLHSRNILLTSTGKVLITDFQTARSVNENSAIEEQLHLSWQRLNLTNRVDSLELPTKVSQFLGVGNDDSWVIKKSDPTSSTLHAKCYQED